MTIRKATPKERSASELVERKLVAFADQLGLLVGSVRAKGERWLDRTMLTTELGRIRDGAADLLAHLHREDTARQETPATPKAASVARPRRGAVDAPGKRHRKPQPQERLDKQMGEPRGKQMGQKNFKSGRRSGRG